MKKRLLITSIVMMLVVAVALSTATYAWFTSNNAVSASTVTMTAAVNSEAAIGIAWTNTAYDTSIVAQSPTHDNEDANSIATTVRFAPMVPSALEAGTTTIAGASPTSGIDFYSATISSTPAKFNSDVKNWGADEAEDQVAPYVWTDGTNKSFFLKNLSDTNALNHVTITATVTGTGADLIRVAVFARIGSTANTAPTGNFTLKKVLSNAFLYTSEANTYVANTKYYTSEGVEIEGITNQETLTAYNATEEQQAYFQTLAGTAYATTGSITAGHLVTTDISSNTTDNAASIDIGGLGANCIAEIIVYVWTDGTALDDARQGEVATIALNIDAAR